MPIDTDDLTDETYNAIMIEAERFQHDLTLQFGLLSYECENERSFILKSKKLIAEMLRYNNVDIDDMFFGNPPKAEDFHQALHKILSNISKLESGKRSRLLILTPTPHIISPPDAMLLRQSHLLPGADNLYREKR